MEALRFAQHKRFGASSEKSEDTLAEQLSFLFNEAEVLLKILLHGIINETSERRSHMKLFDDIKKPETEQKQNANDVIDTCPAAHISAHISAKVKEMYLLFSITTCANLSTGFYLDKTTGEPYIVVYHATLEWYLSMTKVTASDMDAIVSHKMELDYATAYKLQDVIFERSLMGITFSIDTHRYKYQVYLLVDGVEIDARAAMLSENFFEVPTRCLNGCRYTYDYEQYLVRPGPYEYNYDLPVKFIDKVIIRFEAC